MRPTDFVLNKTSISRFSAVCGFSADEAHVAAVANLESRLRTLPSEARKLLAHIVDLATRTHPSGRKGNTAYLPELHETCGLDVDAMYRLLKQLEEASCIQLEGDYPFQDVLLAPDKATNWPLLAELAQFCTSENVSLRQVIVDLDFDVLR